MKFSEQYSIRILPRTKLCRNGIEEVFEAG